MGVNSVSDNMMGGFNNFSTDPTMNMNANNEGINFLRQTYDTHTSSTAPSGEYTTSTSTFPINAREFEQTYDPRTEQMFDPRTTPEESQNYDPAALPNYDPAALPILSEPRSKG